MTSITILIPVCIGIIAVHSVLKAKFTADAEKQKRYARQFQQKSKQTVTSTSQAEGIPEWLYDAMDQLGIGPEVLESEEMPDELTRLIPLAKGFMDGGGLQKLLAGASSNQTKVNQPEQWY